MRKTLIILFISIISISCLVAAEEDRGTIVDYNPLPNNDTVKVTRWYGDWWFGLIGDASYSQFFGDFYAAKNVYLAVSDIYNPEFKFTDGNGFGFSIGLLAEYNPISSPHGAFMSIKYLNKGLYTETAEINRTLEAKYLIESRLKFLEIRPAYRYDFGFINMYGFIGPGIDIGIGQTSESLLKFVNTGDIREHYVFDFDKVSTRIYGHFGVGLDLFVTDLNGTRFRFSPFISADFGTRLLGTQNLGDKESSLNFASARLGVTLKIGSDQRTFDTLKFDPDYKGPDYQVSTLDSDVNLTGNLKDSLLVPSDIAYYELPEPIEIVREEPSVTRPAQVEQDIKKFNMETNRMKFYEFPTSEATQLTAELKSYLDAVARYLQENPSAEIRVVGHSDNLGTAEENQRRSVIRKDRVVRYLLAKGINRYRILDRGEGDRKPIADTRTPEGRKKNRRVEITIIQ